MIAYPLYSLESQVALVTGGSRGIGLVIARTLVRQGARVYISSRDARACSEAVAILSADGDAHALPANLADLKGVDALASAFAARESTLDVLVNNAGAAWGKPIESFSPVGWDKVLDLNLRSVFFLTQRLLPLLRAAASKDGPARVLNVGSVEGLRAPDLETYSYAVSKAGVHHLTRMLAKRLARDDITVNAIAPGPFATKMMARTLAEREAEITAQIPMRRIGRDEDLEAAAIYLCTAAGSFITGHVLPIDGGLTAL